MAGTRIYHYASIVSTPIVWGTREVHHREPDCGELRGRDGRSIQQIYTPEAPGMGVKRNPLTISYIQPWCRQSSILCRKSVWRSNVRQTYVVFLTAVKIGERSVGRTGVEKKELNSQWGWNVKLSSLSKKKGIYLTLFKPWWKQNIFSLTSIDLAPLLNIHLDPDG